MKKWILNIRGQTWTDAFVYFKHEEQAHGPRLAQRMIELNKPS